MLWLECLMNQVGRKEQGRKAPRGRLCLTMAFLRRSKYPSDWISYFLQPNYSKLGWDIKRKLKEHYAKSGRLIMIQTASQATTWRRKRWTAHYFTGVCRGFDVLNEVRCPPSPIEDSVFDFAEISSHVPKWRLSFTSWISISGQIRGNVIIIKRPSQTLDEVDSLDLNRH